MQHILGSGGIFDNMLNFKKRGKHDTSIFLFANDKNIK